MNIYIDESGSINNKLDNKHDFVIAMLVPSDKKGLQRAYKRFVSTNYERLKELDNNESTIAGLHKKTGGKMFDGDRFKELKGSQFDPAMKERFLEFFAAKPHFALYYIQLHNPMLTDKLCANTARAFNYSVRLALEFFLRKHFIPAEDITLQLDERNEKTRAKYFLEDYLNTELSLGGVTEGSFNVAYFDSCTNSLIQLADVFANIYYSNILTGGKYQKYIDDYTDKGMLKYIFEFPQNN